MKILHAVHGFPPEHTGGTELYVERLARAQAAAGHDVVVAAGSIESGYDGFVAQDDTAGIRLYRISQRGLYAERWDHGASPWIERCFRGLLEEHEPDLVHVHHWVRLTRTLVQCAYALGVPSVVTAHDLQATCPRIFRVREDDAFCERPLSLESCLDCVPRESWMHDEEVGVQIERFIADYRNELELASAIVVPGKAHGEVLCRLAGVARERISVVSHPAAIVSRSKPASWHPEGGRPLRVGHWGHLVPFKAPHLLLEAVRAVDHPQPIEVVLWGPAEDPDYARRIDELCAGLSVERRTAFGPADLDALRVDLAVFPTLAHESHSFVVDEAFALGAPVLASDRGALPERIAGAGACFPPGDVSALADLIRTVLDDPDRLRAWQAAIPGPDTVEAHWAELEPIYAAAVAAGVSEPRDLAGERLLGLERVVAALEYRARDDAGLHRAAEEEVRALRKDLAKRFER